jgi:hypothetical protein
MSCRHLQQTLLQGKSARLKQKQAAAFCGPIPATERFFLLLVAASSRHYTVNSGLALGTLHMHVNMLLVHLCVLTLLLVHLCGLSPTFGMSVRAAMASPTPSRMSVGHMLVYSEPMPYTTASARCTSCSTDMAAAADSSATLQVKCCQNVLWLPAGLVVWAMPCPATTDMAAANIRGVTAVVACALELQRVIRLSIGGTLQAGVQP